ncbi:hypothetical protein RHMOL_Rhmol04G0203500 [Rhododendron molle]|uniref:Uncharacterized protein n=1 Tax=Rhododendron molle TaxID=49168 RepID=A0ACC0P451_RHOML|nr:hypothetical protein RHMOL_Rhmol04G0203500 [Rhododendron molle]
MCSLAERKTIGMLSLLKEEIVAINLKDEVDPQMVQIGSTLSPKEYCAQSDLVKEFVDGFARFHPKIVEHQVPLLSYAKLESKSSEGSVPCIMFKGNNKDSPVHSIRR